MSGIAELLANLGYAVSGSDAKRSPVTDRLESLGVTVHGGSCGGECRRRRRGRVLVGGAAGQPRGRGSARAADPGDSARRDARRADAAAVRHRGRRRARQDQHDLDGRAGARAGRTRSDGGDRRPVERVWQQRAAGARGIHGGGSGRERSLVPETVAIDCGDYEHRSRTHGRIRELRRLAAGLHRLRQQGAVLRRRGGVRRRCGALRGDAEVPAPRDHLRDQSPAGADVGEHDRPDDLCARMSSSKATDRAARSSVTSAAAAPARPRSAS